MTTEAKAAAERVQRVRNGEYHLDVYVPRERGAVYTQYAGDIAIDLLHGVYCELRCQARQTRPGCLSRWER